jgi:hypothetical protein
MFALNLSCQIKFSKIGGPLKTLQVRPRLWPRSAKIKQAEGKTSAVRTKMESRLTAIRTRMDVAYIDKLDGKITEALWERSRRLRKEEQQVKMIDGLAVANGIDNALDAESVRTLK